MGNMKQHFAVRSTVLKGHVNKYAMLGLAISIGSIIFASLLVSYQLIGTLSFTGFMLAQTSNPALWALDLTPIMFAYWGQSFCYELANKAELIIEDKTREFAIKSDDLELKLKYDSNHDSLTNLPNTRLLVQRIDQGIQQLQDKEQLAVIIININSFREINYQLGSFSANSLLMQFSEKLKTILLAPYMLQAYMGMNMVARLQGAEFAILIPRLRKEHDLEMILKHLVEATAVSFMIDGNDIHISTTLSAVMYPIHGTNAETLVHHATLSLMHAETEGEAYAIYHPRMDRDYQSKGNILKEINEAIANQEIEVLYQPYFELNTKKIVGGELFINLNGPEYGLLTNDQLFPIVEGTSLSRLLTIFTLKQAIKQLSLWHQENHKIELMLNLHVMNSELVEQIEATLAEYNVSGEYLKVSLTEKTCLSDQTRSMIILNKLVSKGIRVVISDFCSGYSSFVYLTNFPISEVKIDPSFVMNMLKDEKKETIVKGIISLAEVMDLTVIAEGITDEKILQELIKLGCIYGQGSVFAKEMSATDFSAKLTSK